MFLKSLNFACINLETLFLNSDISLSIENAKETCHIKKKIDLNMASFFISFLKHLSLNISCWHRHVSGLNARSMVICMFLKNVKPLTVHEKRLLSPNIMLLSTDTSKSIVLIIYKGEATRVYSYFAHCWDNKVLNCLI